MPNYDYECNSCKHVFEAKQKITEDPLITCPKCKEDSLVRLIGKTAFSLKGGGWFSSGYQKK